MMDFIFKFDKLMAADTSALGETVILNLDLEPTVALSIPRPLIENVKLAGFTLVWACELSPSSSLEEEDEEEEDEEEEDDDDELLLFCARSTGADSTGWVST